MNQKEFHQVLLCIVHGSKQVFKTEKDCFKCEFCNLCDEIVSIFFKYQNKNQKEEEQCQTLTK